MPIHQIETFRGGISEETNKGLPGAFKFGCNLDIRKFSDTLSCNQAMVKDSGSVIVDLPMVGFACSDGHEYLFGDTGKIYERDSGSWTLKATDADGEISGACEWNGYIYWTTSTRLKRTPLGGSMNFASPSSVSTGLSSGYKHPMKPIGGYLIVGNGTSIAGVSPSGVFTLLLCPITPDCFITCLDDKDGYIVAGAWKNSTTSDGYLFLIDPDRFGDPDVTWTKRFRIPSNGVNSLVTNEGVFAQAGNSLYLADFVNVTPINTLDGGTTYQGATTTRDSVVLMGVFNNDHPGVYSYGRLKQNLNPSLNLEYTLSPDSGLLFDDPFITAIQKIGCVFTSNDYVFVSWKTAAGYGVDILSFTEKADAVYESLELMVPPNIEKPIIVKEIKALMVALPTGCSITVKYKADKATTWTTAYTAVGGTSYSTTGAIKAYWNPQFNPEICYEYRYELTHYGNTTPEIIRSESYIQTATRAPSISKK